MFLTIEIFNSVGLPTRTVTTGAKAKNNHLPKISGKTLPDSRARRAPSSAAGAARSASHRSADVTERRRSVFTYPFLIASKQQQVRVKIRSRQSKRKTLVRGQQIVLSARRPLHRAKAVPILRSASAAAPPCAEARDRQGSDLRTTAS